MFDYWLGDDCVDKIAKTIAKILFEFHQNTRVPIYFIHGNRDFLLRESYAKRCGMKIFPETALIDLYGVKTLVLHGVFYALMIWLICVFEKKFVTVNGRI